MQEVSKKNLSPEAKRALLAQLLREKAQAKETWEPISSNQKALWFLYRLAPDSAAYNLLYAARVQSPLDVVALQRALSKLAQRYPILSATYALHNGQPAQRLAGNRELRLEEIDATSWSLDYLAEHLKRESNRPMNLEQGPLLRITLFKRAVDDYALAFIAHHIAVDFWALDILVDELYVLYMAESAGLPNPLPQLGPQHSDFVRWQNTMLAGEEGEQHWDYWRSTLAGELPVLSLPTDYPRPLVQTYKGASHSFAIARDVTRKLRALASAEKVTLFTLMLSAYQTFLYRYTNQEDIIVGTPALGRNHADWERVIDYLANPVLIRAKLTDNPTFQELLAQTRQGVLDALEHQDFPFPLLVERLQPRRDPGYSPIYQTLFIWDRPRARGEQDLSQLGRGQGNLVQIAAQEKLTFEPFAYGQQGAPFDLTLTVFEINGELTADFRYNVDLFKAETIARMEQDFQTLLAGIVEQPTQSLLALPLLAEPERNKILFAWNDTKSDYPDHTSLHRLIEEQVERTPENPALIFAGQTRSYRELNNEANQLAHRLQQAGVRADTLVGVSMERSLEMVVALLAILKAGGAYVPLDPGYPAERLAYMIEDAQVPILLTQTSVRERLPQSDATTLYIDSGWNISASEPMNNPTSDVQPDNLAYMIYTSGSTGKPKGVMNTHRGICNRLHWMQQAYQLDSSDRVLQKTPFSFDVSVWEFFWPLLTGAEMVIAKPGGQQDPAYLVELIKEHQVTTLHFVPSLFQVFLQEKDLEECSSLKHIVTSGEALTLEQQENFFLRFPAARLSGASLESVGRRNQENFPTSVGLHNLYGPTEAAIDVSYWECKREEKQRSIPIGYPIANIQLHILNAALQPVPIGVAGELYIGGVGLARGYFNQPELNAEKFIANPFSQEEGARLFKTADLARYRADGAIEFLGRIDHQVKIRGFRIELGEIETVLSQHPALKDVVVVAREDIPGNKRLVAYLVAKNPNAQPALEELRAFLKEKLPEYMVPVVFLFLEALPLSPNGKVNRTVLPAPDTERPDLQITYVAPRTETEERLAGIWAQVLGIDSVGVHDNYFDLGGASIQSLDIISRANEAGLSLALEMLFEFQTVAELAAAIDAKQEEALNIPSANKLRSSSAQAGGEEQQEKAEPIEDSIVAPAAAIAKAQVQEQAKVDLSNTIIESLGTYLPPKVVTSEEIIQGCSIPLRFPLAKLTGIKTRRMAGETEFSLDIAKQAVADCLANSKYNPQDIDLIVCGNISRCNTPGLQFMFEPNTAVQIQQHFGFTNAIALDVSNACTGLFTAAYVIDSFIKAGLIRRGIAVSGEYISHLVLTAQREIESFMDSRLACLTVGDAGAAFIMERSPDKKVGFHEFEMYTLGRYSEACIGKATEREHGGGIMYTDAVTVSAVNMKQAVSHAGLVIERSQWQKDAFQHIIVHQTSQTTINDVAREINNYFGQEICKQESVINNIAERGNTATTTHMIAVMDNIRNNRIQSGDNAIFGITGSGATIGTALYTFDNLPDRIRRREAGEYTPSKIESEEKFTPRLPVNRRIRVESIGTILAGASIEKKTLPLIEAAAKQCLANSTYQKSDIDLLIYSGVYRDDFLCEPAVAALVEGMLSINDDIETQQDKKTFALDLLNGSLGTLDACYTAIGMMQSEKIKNALIVTSEIENNREKSPDELAGIEETGSALLLDESPDGRTGFGNFVFKSFTDYVGTFGSRSIIRNGKTIMHFQRDLKLERYYIQCIRTTVQELLDLEQLTMQQIKVILPPQISSDFITGLSRKLEIERDRFVDVGAKRDLFTSSLPYALEQARREQRVKAGDIGLIINVGSGIQVGCASYHF